MFPSKKKKNFKSTQNRLFKWSQIETKQHSNANLNCYFVRISNIKQVSVPNKDIFF